MKPLNWLKNPAKLGIQGAISDGIKVVLLALAGALLTRFIGLSGTFWATKVAVSELGIWVCVTAAISALITHSIMQRKLARIEAEAAQKEQKAKDLSLVDLVTGLLNLRAFKEQLPKAMEAAHQTKRPLTMVIFDIDDFREVNRLCFTRARI